MSVGSAGSDPAATALAAVAAGSHRRWDGRRWALAVPDDYTGRLRRVYVRRVLYLEAVADPAAEDDRREHWTRAGGGVVCRQCGLEYYDHPADPAPGWHDLTVLCDRTRVKL